MSAKSDRENAVYRVALSMRRARGTREIKNVQDFIQNPEKKFERVQEIMNRRIAEGRAVFGVPYGPRQVPEKDKINFVGIGSGFDPSTPRLKRELELSPSDSEKPFEDVQGGSEFRSSSWVVTERTKMLLTQLDPVGFDFLPVATEFKIGRKFQPGPEMWLCEAIRFLRCLENPNATDATALQLSGALVFSANEIGGAAFFREATRASEFIFCTDAARDALDAAGITGLSFDIWGHQRAGLATG